MKASPALSFLRFVWLLLLSFGWITDVISMCSSPRHHLLHNTDTYSSIVRVPLILSSSNSYRSEYAAGELTTLKPKGWLRRALRGARLQQKWRRDVAKRVPFNVYEDNYEDDVTKIGITDVIYLPSLLSTHVFDITCHGGDDDHMSSIISDEGYDVHVISLDPRYANVATQIQALDRVLKTLIPANATRASSSVQDLAEPCISANNVAIISSELSCISALRYLTEIALPLSSLSTAGPSTVHGRVNIGALILVDPPPVSPLCSSITKRRILDRYTDALQGEESFCTIVTQNDMSYNRNEISNLYQEYVHWFETNKDGKPCQCLKYLIKDNIRDGVNAVKYVDSEKGEKIEGAVDYMKEVALMESEARKKSGEYHPLYSSSRQGKKKKRNSSLAHSIYTKHGESIVSCTMKGDDDHDHLVSDNVDERVDDLLGTSPPRNLHALGDAMKDRILVIDTDRIHYTGNCSIFDGHMNGELDDVADNWGPIAMREIGSICNALPLISIGNNDCEDENVDNLDPNIADINAITHHRVARKITDWFSLLQRYDFL